MKVITPKGIIESKQSSDTEYPGIWVSINDEPLVLVEFDYIEGKHVIRVWNEDRPDEECEYKQVLNS